MDAMDLMHSGGKKKRTCGKKCRRALARGRAKAKCVRSCRAGTGRFKRGKHTKVACRKRCHVKAK